MDSIHSDALTVDSVEVAIILEEAHADASTGQDRRRFEMDDD